MSSDWTQRCSRSQSLLAALTVICRSTPPFQAQVTLSLVPRQHYHFPHYSPLLQPLLQLPPPVWCSQPCRRLTEHVLGEIPTVHLLHLPLPGCGSSSSLLHQKGLTSLWSIVHQGFSASITFHQSRWKELFYFSRLFSLLPMTKSLSHPSIS